MQNLPRQEMSYSLVKPADVIKFAGDWPGLISTTTSIARVDFQQRTIILPEGKFDLDNFMCIAKDICLRLPR